MNSKLWNIVLFIAIGNKAMLNLNLRERKRVRKIQLNMTSSVCRHLQMSEWKEACEACTSVTFVRSKPQRYV